MSRVLTQRSQARIVEFLSEWSSRSFSRGLDAAERAMVGEALVDYLLVENAYASSAQEAVAPALDFLGELDGEQADDARAAVLDVARELDQQHELNLILREHLVLATDENRRLRAVRGNPHPSSEPQHA